ncbi:MAG: DUF1049 domain-containing protein [Betaproteobacteria bacterium]|nr:DUF1049 domain-containing protein [Betaproteobacteria bacterium]
MRAITWAFRIVIFLLLLAFAVKNTEPVALRFFFNLEWKAPLVALMLLFFAAGAALGVAAMLGAWLRQRRELQRLRSVPAQAAPPPADA